MDDFISRQAAIDAVHSTIFDFFRRDEDDSPMAESDKRLLELNKAITTAIRKLPTIDVPERKVGKWDMFELITSVYFGKQYYFLQYDGLVYSRSSHKYMTEDAAITEFLNAIGE